MVGWRFHDASKMEMDTMAPPLDLIACMKKTKKGNDAQMEMDCECVDCVENHNVDQIMCTS